MKGDPMPPPRLGLGLALVGYRGTGKSTVGRLVASMANRQFLDVDLEIAARSGRSIGAIFAESGEPAFRDWEEQTLAELIGLFPGAVIAPGGGSVLREPNRRRLREFGHVVWLTAVPGELARRLEADDRGKPGRPALTAAGTTAEIEQVLRERTPLYEGLADSIIETGGKSPAEVAAAVLASWKTWAEA
jgi:shikimate kinase